tara:strand:- start:19 stop:1317 length:1299 start_codon:yes stop_codon:yes gene_type:complete
MRNDLVHIGADELTYDIRGIVSVAEEVEKLGQSIVWENIGDPVEKGENIPDWIKSIVKGEIENDKNFGYGPTRGLKETREFLASLRNKEGGVHITPDDILFFNGLGDAISKLYTYLNRNARIIGPSPAYSTHSSAEGAHAGAHHVTYNLLPDRNWLPDLNDLRNKIHYNPQISGILIINPDNPTGMVYPKKVLLEIVELARDYGLFIISDEVYANIIYGDEDFAPLSEVVNGVPGIALRGISKEMPWPGSRCGWMEVYNKDTDTNFERYIQTIVDAKMLEVCSTTLPQSVIPHILNDSRYKDHLKERREKYKKRADEAYKILSGTKGIMAPKPGGAFYMTVVFENGALKNGQTLSISNSKIKEYIEEHIKDVPLDKRFVYYLLGATGICVVPLSSFNSDLAGFRITLLENDDKTFTEIFTTLKKALNDYLSS